MLLWVNPEVLVQGNTKISHFAMRNFIIVHISVQKRNDKRKHLSTEKQW